MKKILLQTISLLFFLLFICCMLLAPKLALSFSLCTLELWYRCMLPALLPFMILSNLLIGLHLNELLVCFLRPLFCKLFYVNGHGVYNIVIGFLCGFPMGAKTAADLYQKHLITKTEAQHLLFFTNNIGPIYFSSYILPLFPQIHPGLLLFGMYGIPLLYGVILRQWDHLRNPSHGALSLTPPIQAAALPTHTKAPFHTKINLPFRQLLLVFDDAVQNSLVNIARLGGYMIFFSLLNLLPKLCFTKLVALFPSGALSFLYRPASHLIACLLEITSGIQASGNAYPLLALPLLPFGGLSCIAQTGCMLRNTDLSLGNYIFHKCILTLITLLFYCQIIIL